MLEKYYFLFLIALVWILFAVVQDLRTREISNWLNFSLIAIVLAYRAFYSLSVGSYDFFVYGLFGILGFVFLGYLFYYAKIFAGGDAKLLFGLGGVLPIESFGDLLVLGGGFVMLLFLVGVVYTLIYTAFLVNSRWKEFSKDFGKRFREKRKKFYLLLIIILVLVLVIMKDIGGSSLILMIFPLTFLLYIYVKSVEKVCMMKYLGAKDLTEGDWLERDVRVGGKVIRKSVHGLSKKEIGILKKAKKKVWIKDGVPFSPAFLGAFLVFVYLWVKGIFLF